MKKILAFILSCFMLVLAKAQSYTSYFSGDTADVSTAPIAGTVLMGGATENDNAMRWFLNRADGGDILVIRTDDSNGYNDYFFTTLGIDVNSVETIVFNDAAAAYDETVLNHIKNCEALWIAGGDQWNYVSYWKDTPVEDAINFLINEKHVTVGGTSAGSAIQGDAYFSAENGTATSAQSLNNPYNVFMTIGYHDFINNPVLTHVITDTHFDNPDRRGRSVAFLARLVTDYGFNAYAIACEEYTAVCIDENKIAHAFGDYPSYDDYVYFIQTNCIEPNTPENCTAGNKLTWIRDNAALKVIVVGADNDGAAYVDLNDWKTAGGGDYSWQNWWADDGTFNYEESVAINCDTADVIQQAELVKSIGIYPNPAHNYLVVPLTQAMEHVLVKICDSQGKIIFEKTYVNTNKIQINIADFAPSLYAITLESNGRVLAAKFVKE